MKKIKSNDSIEVTQVKILIYGQPGLGKTTLSLTAKNPLVLDFDNGAHRAGNRRSGEVWQIESWNDIVEMMKNPKELQAFDTIIIDTVGKCLDFLIADIINENPKSGNKKGNLTISGWGDLKGTFSAWIKQLIILGKDIIMIAHDKEKDENDVRILRPDVSGGSYGEIVKQADFIGYMSMVDKNRVLDFNPTDRTIGKNSACFPALTVPDVASNPLFLADKIEEMKVKLSGMSEQDLEIRKELETMKLEIAEFTDAYQFDNFLIDLQTKQEPLLTQAQNILWRKAKTLNLDFDKKSRTFTEKVV